MTLFAIISTEQRSELKEAVEKNFQDAYFEISPSQFLVNAKKMTANQISVKIDAPSGNLGRVLVLLVSDYGGWHSKDMWAWLIAQIVPAQILPQEDKKDD